MSTVTHRIRDDLKKKAQAIAREHHVSLNNCVNVALSAAVAQTEPCLYSALLQRGSQTEQISLYV